MLVDIAHNKLLHLCFDLFKGFVFISKFVMVIFLGLKLCGEKVCGACVTELYCLGSSSNR